MQVMIIFLGTGIVFLLQLSNTAEARAELLGLSGGKHVPGEFLVVVKGSKQKREETVKRNLEHVQAFIEMAKTIADDDGGEIQYLQKILFHSLGVLHVRVTSKAALESLLEHPLVDYVETNKIGTISGGASTSCAQQNTGSDLWGLSRISARVRPNYTEAEYEYNSAAGEGVEVYIIDTGVYVDHSEFEGRATFGYAEPNISREGNTDLNGHGTHVAGTVAGKTYGVAKAAHVIAVKALSGSGSGTVMGVTLGVQWACNDFRAKTDALGKDRVKGVVNMSLRFFQAAIVLDEAIRRCVDEDNLPFVVAAGNEGDDSCTISPPRGSSIITVGATNVNDELARFSNYGPCVDILAPGEGIKSAGIGGPNRATTLSGTSMASPHVAGAVASLLSGLPRQPSAALVKALLLDASTRDVVNPAYPRHAGEIPNRLLYSGCSAQNAAEFHHPI